MKRVAQVMLGAHVLAALTHFCLFADGKGPPRKLDPAAWGSDHVGKELPEYMTGGECLFCHGKDVGVHWQTNPHQLTIRPAAPESEEVKALVAEIDSRGPDFVMGRDRILRYLRKGKGYGKLDTHSHYWNPHTRAFAKGPTAVWDADYFGLNCAGCHTTGVDSKSQSFSSLAVDCYGCHGDVDRTHTEDPSKVLLSPKRKDPARVTTSICASCHLRGGQSRSTQRPYPNNFVPGDNLFRDFQVAFEAEAVAKLNPADRHVHENVRDVVVRGIEAVTCTDCHDVHRSSTSKHERLPKTLASCATCHEEKAGKWMTKEYEVHSNVCGY